MTDRQLWLMIGVPVLLNAALTLLLLIFLKVRFDRLIRRANSLNKKLDDLRDFWAAKLNAFEQRVGSRLTK